MVSVDLLHYFHFIMSGFEMESVFVFLISFVYKARSIKLFLYFYKCRNKTMGGVVLKTNSCVIHNINLSGYISHIFHMYVWLQETLPEEQ